jgi:thymidine phosphorylase
VLANGRALEHFARMVAASGARPISSSMPPNGCRKRRCSGRCREARRVGEPHRHARAGPRLHRAGRRAHKSEDSVDPRVGLTGVVALGERVEAAACSGIVHAARESDADLVTAMLANTFTLAEERRPLSHPGRARRAKSPQRVAHMSRHELPPAAERPQRPGAARASSPRAR